MSSSVTFFTDMRSQPCRAVYLFLKLNKIPFKLEKVDLLKGEHRSPEFLKKNPYHKVPLISDGGFFLSESAAIMRYLAVTNKVADHWYPRSDPKKQARCDEFLNWQQSGIRKPCIDIFLETLRNSMDFGRFPKKPMDEEKVKAAKDELARGLTHLVDYFIQDKQFIVGDEVSAADILAICELYQLHGVGLLDSLVRSNKKVDAWMERVIKALQPEFDVACTDINGVREMFDKAS